MNGEKETSELHEVDIDIESEQPKRPKWLPALFAVPLLAAVAIATLFLTSNDESEVDVAADDAAAVEQDDAEETASPSTTVGPDDSADSGNVVATTVGPREDFVGDAMMDTEFGFGGGPGGVVFDGEQFVAFGYSETGPTIRTSTDGIDWDTRPIAGLEPGANAWMLVEHDGTFATVIEQWDTDGMEEDSPFGFSGQPTFSLATSTDLENWTVSELSLPTEDGYSANFSGLALGDAGVVILAQSYPDGPDEMRILFEAGILTEDDFEQYCGLDFGENESGEQQIIVQACDYRSFEEPSAAEMEEFERRYSEAESDEERQALEMEFDQILGGPEPTVLATITADDPAFALLDGIYDAEFDEDVRTTVLAGPIDGQLALATLPATGHANNVVEVDGTFAVVVSDYTELGASMTVLTSTDGRVWSAGGALPDGMNGQLATIGSNLVVVGSNDQGTPTLLLSTDLGASWSPIDFNSELYGAYPMMVSGPAGAVAFLTGSLEPIPDYGPEGPIEITSDGYTLTIGFTEDSGITLTGPDGAVIHELSAAELEESGDDDIPGVVRLNPLTDTPTFLDPVTGEDLVSFTNEDFEEAYGSFDQDFVEPDMATKVLFSADGLTWTTLDDERLISSQRGSDVSPVAIGDDELIVVRQTWNEPSEELFAFEIEGREPTAEEIAALDAWEQTNNGENAAEYFRIELN